MFAVDPEGAHLSGFTAESVAALAGPPWLRAWRGDAFKRFRASRLPTESLEEWRYSRIEELQLDSFVPAPPPAAARGEGSDIAAALLAALEPVSAVVETVDGHLVGLRQGSGALLVEDLARLDGETPPAQSPAEPDPYVMLNRAFAPTPVRVGVARGAQAGTVVVVHRAKLAKVASFPRLLVDLEDDASLSVVEVLLGGRGSLVVPVTELRVGAGSQLNYLAVQALDPGAWQLAYQSSRVSRDASFVSAAVALGGDYARLRTDSTLEGPGAAGRLLAVYFASGSQMHDFRTLQRHAAPKTQSDLLYKGVVANRSRSVYSGLIRVEKGAKGTSAMQTNRNLVLHEGAHADSVPNLEIEDNDVRCSHASAVGPIALDQRFYLESRGVPPARAERLIALGFLSEVIEQLPVEAVEGVLRSAIEAKLSWAEAEEAGGDYPGMSSQEVLSGAPEQARAR